MIEGPAVSTMDPKKFPSTMNTRNKRIKRARGLVEEHLGVKTTRGELSSFQGMWSETHIVSLENGTKVVIQFRAEPLDIAPFVRARELLGEYVPNVELLHDEGLRSADIWPVYMSYIQGTAWAQRLDRNDTKINIAAMKSLGRLLARCVVNEGSPASAQDDVIARLDKRLQSARREIDPFRDIIRDLKARAQTCDLESLPLFCSHMDLNHMNIMVLDDGQVSGILDWELSPPLQPFGMGLHRIHDLAGEFRQGIYHEFENYEEMERSFWSELMNALPANHRKLVTGNPYAVQTSLTIGSILWAFDIENGDFINPVVVRALPKFLTYRIPAIRGNDAAYANPSYPGESAEAT